MEEITLTVKALSELLEAAYNNGCLQRPYILNPKFAGHTVNKPDKRTSMIDYCLACEHHITNGGDEMCGNCPIIKRFM